MSRDGTIDELCRLLERYCPATWKRITGKRYQLPDYRVADYVSQVVLHKNFIKRFWDNLTEEHGDEVLHHSTLTALWCNQILGLHSNRPTYFLKPDHGAALMRTDLPADLSFSDIRWRHPQLRIMLPRNLIRYYDSVYQTKAACVCIDLARTESGTRIYFPKEVAWELDLWPHLYQARQERGLGLVEEMEFGDPSSGLVTIATLEPLPSESFPHRPFDILSYLVEKSAFETLLAAQEHFDLTLEELMDKNLIGERLAHLGLQCLLYMSREEEEPPETIIRRARMEGRHLQSSIVRARFVDEYCHKVPPGQARIVASYEGKRSSPVGHWVRGHWHRFAVGQGRLERRLQWVQPFQRGESSADDGEK